MDLFSSTDYFYSRKVASWAIANHMRTDLVTDAFLMAVWRKQPNKELIHRTDRRSQYTSDTYRELLKKQGMACRMWERELL